MMFVLVLLFSFGETPKRCFWSIRFSCFLFMVVTVIIFMCNIIDFCLGKMITTGDDVFDMWSLFFLQKSLSPVNGSQFIEFTFTDVCLCLAWHGNFAPGLHCL